MRVDLVIRGGSVVTPAGVVRADVAVEGGRVVAVGEGVGSGREEIVADGLHVFPGVVDSHVHFNEPGRAEWEGFDTGSAALVAGGGTTFFDMPLNSSPPVLDGASFDNKAAAATASSRADFGLWGGLTPSNVDRLEELAERGVVGFKAFMSNSGIGDFGHADDYTLWRGMKVAARYGLVVGVHAENDAITGALAAEAVKAGRVGVRDYLASRPVVAEVEAIGRAIALAGDAGCKLHVVHVSSAAGVAAVVAGRARGVDVTCETCPHYLVLGEEDVERLGAAAKCAPPLRGEADREGLWRGLEKGEVGFVASDHSPAPLSMKGDANFFKVWGGITGVQSTLGVMLSREGMGLERVARYTAEAPAERYGVRGKGRVEVGFDADFALVDLGARYELTREGLFDRHKLSPYVGRRFRGVVERVVLRGRTIFHKGKLTSGPGGGRLVRPG